MDGGVADVLGKKRRQGFLVPLAEDVHALGDFQAVQGKAHVLAAPVILQDGFLFQVQGSGLHAVINGEQGILQDGGVLFAAFLGDGVHQHTQEVLACFLFIPADFHGVHAAAAESEPGVQGSVEQGVGVGRGLESADNFKVEGHIAQEWW